MLKWALSERKINYSWLWCRVYDSIVRSERVCVILILPVLYFYFSILFCQNKVKKICNFSSEFSLKTADIRRDTKPGKCLSDVCWWLVTVTWICHYVLEYAFTVYVSSCYQKIFRHYMAFHEWHQIRTEILPNHESPVSYQIIRIPGCKRNSVSLSFYNFKPGSSH